MGCLRRQTVFWVLGIISGLAWIGPAFAQSLPSMPVMSQNQSTPSSGDSLTPPEYSSAVSVIDSVFPRTQIRLRVELDYHATRPQRAEFLWAQGIFPGTPGPPRPETSLSYQELS